MKATIDTMHLECVTAVCAQEGCLTLFNHCTIMVQFCQLLHCIVGSSSVSRPRSFSSLNLQLPCIQLLSLQIWHSLLFFRVQHTARPRRPTSEPMLPYLDAGHLCVGPSLQVESILQGSVSYRLNKELSRTCGRPQSVRQAVSNRHWVGMLLIAAVGCRGVANRAKREADTLTNRSPWTRIQCLSIFYVDIIHIMS